MDEIFNPSLLISLGPSGRKALDFSKKLLTYLPEHFLNIIDFYTVESLEKLSSEVQAIVDTKLLSAKYLNKLVDLGYKVRSESISSVKLNIYLLWDVYSSEQSAYEVVKALTSLNYGNVDKDQHSGVSLFILPMMDKEWMLEDKNSIKEIKKLNKIIDFISLQENILNLDSKVYVLHCVSNDGTRIPKEELEYIGGILTYLNILPSKDPPLSHFNRRLLMNESAYKVGTIGITTLTVFKDKLLKDFSRYLSVDLLSYAVDSEVDIDYSCYAVCSLLSCGTQRQLLKRDVNIVEADKGYKLRDMKKYELELPKDIALYPNRFKNWEEFIEHQCLSEMKKTIDRNNQEFTDKVIKNIEEDLKDITLKYSLKEGIKYITSLEEELGEQKPSNKSSMSIDTSGLNRQLASRVDNFPNLFGYIVKCLILGAFFLYSIVNIAFPRLSTALSVACLLGFTLMFCLLASLEYLFTKKRFKTFLEKYKEEIFRKTGAQINLYIERSISEGQKNIFVFLSNRKSALETCIKSCKEASKSIAPNPLEEEEKLGNLITDLLDFKDREGFYREKAPRISDMYRIFIKELGGYEGFNSTELKKRLLDYSLSASAAHTDLDFFEYMSFKYKDNIENDLSSWLNKGIIKSKYLLQYINSDRLEEHSLFITSPEVYRIAKDMRGSIMSDFQVSVIEGRDIYTNCISIIRLCLGVEFNNIASVKKAWKKAEDDEEVMGGDSNA